MGERVKAAVAGPNFSALPAIGYNYGSAIGVAIGDTTTPSASAIPAGLYRISVDKDCYVTCAATPTATRDGADSAYYAAGTFFHEVFDGVKKIAVINKTNGETGILRLHPAETIV